MLHEYLQHCILPRVTYSPADAAFCARFTQRLHELALPFFPTILYFDTVRFSGVPPRTTMDLVIVDAWGS